MDLKALGESLGLERDEFVEIVDIFLETAYTDVEKLAAAFDSKDTKAASEAAHSLKGSAGNLGFMDIAGLAGKLESRARQNDISGVADAIPELDAMLNLIKDAM